MLLVAEPHSTASHPVKKEPAEPESLAPSHTDIQLLPQQAGMASILATAVINSKYTLMPPSYVAETALSLSTELQVVPRSSRSAKIYDAWHLSRGGSVLSEQA